MSKLSNSYGLVVSSWRLIRSAPEMVWFPILNCIVTVLAIGGITAIGYFGLGITSSENISQNFHQGTLGVIEETLFVLIVAVIIAFINFYFNTALIFIANEQLNSRNTTFAQGIQAASSISLNLFFWSCISVLVGWILSYIERFRIVGWIISKLLGTAWALLTYFTIPVMVLDKKGPWESAKKSAEIFKSVWGETLVVNIGVGFFFGIVTFVLFLATIGSVVIFFDASFMLAVYSIFAFTLAIFIIGIISSVMTQVVKLVLYRYAVDGQVPMQFNKEVVESILKKK